MLTAAGRNPLRILYVAERLPGRAGFGGELRCLHIARALSEMGRVEVAWLRRRDKEPGAVEEDCEFPVVCVLDVTRRPNQGLAEKMRWTFDPGSNYPFGLGVDAEAARSLRSRLGEYNLIWFFNLRAPDFFPNAPWPRSVVDIDDMPTTYLAAALQTAGGSRQRWMERRRMYAWRRRERLLGERFTAIAVCSEQDRQFLRRLGVSAPAHVIPNGFEMPAGEPVHRPASPPRIGFIGLLDYLPNRDAIDWFVRQCWPLVRKCVPEARLRIAGQDAEGFLRYSDPGIDRLGWLANPDEEMETWSAMVVPIRIGAGTRMKIAHAFSCKCPVVSTAFGAYGYEAVDGREICLADTAEAFAEACVRCIRQPQQAAEMAERAWKAFVEKWTWDAIRPRVWAAAESCLDRLQGAANPLT